MDRNVAEGSYGTVVEFQPSGLRWLFHLSDLGKVEKMKQFRDI